MTAAIVGRNAAFLAHLASASLLVAPRDLASGTAGLPRAVIVGPRHIDDDDLASIRTVPTIFVLETGTDFVHMRMHLKDRRVTLTPFDRIHVLPAAEPWCFANPWVEPYRCTANNIPTFLQAGAPGPIGPEGFDGLAKADYDHMAQHLTFRAGMNGTPLVGSDETCKLLLGCLFDPTRIRLHTADSRAQADVLVGPPSALENSGTSDGVDKPFRGIWIVPAVLSDDNPIELLLARYRSVIRSPLHLLDLFALPATGGAGTPVILTVGFG